MKAIADMTIYNFISKVQSSYCKDCKENLENYSCIVIPDFVENFMVPFCGQGLTASRLGPL